MKLGRRVIRFAASNGSRAGLVAAVLLASLAVIVASPASAGVLSVGCGASRIVDLISAVDTANATPATADTIVLATGCTYTFTASNQIGAAPATRFNWYGPNALPAIVSPITIEGNGAIIERSSVGGTPKFRLFYVGADPTRDQTINYTSPGVGDLTLRNLTVRNGLAKGGDSNTGGGGAGMGGAVFSQGFLTLAAVTLTANTAQGGSGGVGAATAGGGIGTDASGTTGGGFGAGTFGGAAGGAGSAAGAGGGGGGFATGNTGAAGTAGGAGGGPASGTGGAGGDIGGAAGNGSGGGGRSSTPADPSAAGGGFGSGGSGGATATGAGGGGVGGGGGSGTAGGGGGFGAGGGAGGLLSGGGDGGFGGGGGGGGGGTAGYGAGDGNAVAGGGGAGMGGAVFNHHGVVTVVNSTVALNTALGGTGGVSGQGLGGAIFNLNGTVTSNFTTIARNTAAQGGGGLYNIVYDSAQGQTALAIPTRTIVADSVGGVDNVVNLKPATTAAGANHANNNAQVVTDTSLIETPNTGTIGGTPLADDPNLAGALAVNGATNRPQTLALQSPSLAIDAGGATCVPNVDQRGFARPAGAGCDLGAFEAAAAAFPALVPGHVLVVDQNVGTGQRGALFDVDPTTGTRTLRSDFSQSVQGPLGSNPIAVGVTSTGGIFVLDRDAGTSSAGALFRVDPATGQRTVISDFGDAGQGPIGADPVDLALDLGRIWVVDANAGTGSSGALFSVNPATGARTVVTDFGDGPNPGIDPAGVDVASTGELIVVDRGPSGGAPGLLYRVDPATGVRTVVSDFTNAAQGASAIDPSGVTVTPAGTIVVVDRYGINGFPDGRVLWVDPVSGYRTILDEMKDGSPAGGQPLGVAVTPAGHILTANASGSGTSGQLIDLDPATGSRTRVNFSLAEYPNADPIGLAIVPQPLNPGDIWVIDPDAGAGSNGVLFRVDRTTGERVVVSDFNTGAATGVNPSGLAITSAGQILVTDADAGTSGQGTLFRVDPATGARTVVTDFGTGVPDGSNPQGVVVGPGGSVFVVDADGPAGPGALLKVNPATGAVTILGDFSAVPAGLTPRGLAIGPSGAVLVADADINGTGALFSVNPITGTRTSIGNFALSPAGDEPSGVAVTAAGLALVIDREAGTADRGALFSVNIGEGASGAVSDFGASGQGPLGTDPVGLALTSAGTALVVDRGVQAQADGSLFVVNASSGNRTLLSNFTNAGQGPTGNNPTGVAVVPVQQPSLLVMDPQAGSGLAGMIFRVDPITGMRSIASEYGRLQQGSLGIDPYGAALTPTGRLWTVDLSTGTSRLGGLDRADSLIGTRSLAHDFGAGANPARNPTAVAVLPSGLLAVVDPTTGTDGRGAVYTVNPTTGARALLSDFGNSAQGSGLALGQEPMGATLDANGRLIVIDVRAGSAQKGALFVVDTTTGQRTVLTNFGVGSPQAVGVRGVALGPSGQLLVADHGGQGVPGMLWSVDPTTGNRTVAALNLGSDPFGVIVRADGSVYVADDSAGTNGRGGLFRITLSDGSRTLVSDFGNAAQGPIGDAPIGGAAAASLSSVDGGGPDPARPLKDKKKDDGSCALVIAEDGCSSG